MKRLRKRLDASGPGVVIAVIALIFALAGTAFAAAGLNGTQKKEVKKIAKQFAGKPGAPGAQGQAGAKGDTGPQGAKGDKGDTGNTGNQGLPGTDGKSVEVVTEGPTACGPSQAGVIYEVEGSAEENKVCEGSPWTAGGTLPAGAQETGDWFVADTGGPHDATAISFPIKLSGSIEAENIHVTGGSEFSTFCKENVSRPLVASTAPPGTLCIFVGISEEASNPAVLGPDFEENVTRTGAIIQWNLEAEGYAAGSFAVSGS